MPAYMSKSTLLNLSVGNMDDPGTNGFARAAKSAADALDTVEPILGAIGDGNGPARGGVWSGAGQPEATLVLKINRTALEVAKIEMGAAVTAVSALQYALLDCRGNLKNFVQTAESNDIDVAEDGTCTYRNPEDDRDGRGDPDLMRLTATVKQILKLATVADLDARSSLSRVTANTPSTSDTADPAVLQQANDALDQALEDKRSIEESAALWLTSQAPTWQEYANGGGGSEAANRLLDHLLDTWTTLGPGNHTLVAVLRNGLVAGVADVTPGALLGLFKRDEQAAGVAKVGGRVLHAAGVGVLALETVLGIISLYQRTDDGRTPVKTNPEVRLADPELADIVAPFYPEHDDEKRDGNGNLADLAHYQRVTGTPADGNDWVERAQQLRSRLQAWADSHPDAADYAYAQDLIQQLDEGIGSVAPTGPDSVPGTHGGKHYR